MKNFVFQGIFLTLGGFFSPHWNDANPHWSLDHWNKTLSPDFIQALLQTTGVVSSEPVNLLVCIFSHLWRREVGLSESHSMIIELGIIPG